MQKKILLLVSIMEGICAVGLIVIGLVVLFSGVHLSSTAGGLGILGFGLYVLQTVFREFR